MNDILSQIIAYSPNKIDTETKARAMVQGPRNMKLAEVPRSEMDNINTPDLEQSPDSYLRPGETLEDFDVTFRRPNAQGGRIPFGLGGQAIKEKNIQEAIAEFGLEALNAGAKKLGYDNYKAAVGDHNAVRKIKNHLKKYGQVLTEFEARIFGRKNKTATDKLKSKLPKTGAKIVKGDYQRDYSNAELRNLAEEGLYDPYKNTFSEGVPKKQTVTNRIVDIEFADPKIKEEFMKDFKKRYEGTRATSGKRGVDNAALYKKYLSNLTPKTAELALAGLQSSMAEKFGDDYRYKTEGYYAKATKTSDAYLERMANDPQYLKKKARDLANLSTSKGKGLGILQHMYPKRMGDALNKLAIDTTNITKFSEAESILQNLDFEKSKLMNDPIKNKRRIDEIQAIENRIVKGKTVPEVTSTSRRVNQYEPEAKTKYNVKFDRPGQKGLFGFEKIDTSNFSSKLKGADLSKSIGGTKKDILSQIDFKKVNSENAEQVINIISDELKRGGLKISKTQSKGIAKKLSTVFECTLAEGVNCNDPASYKKSIKEQMAKASQGDTKAISKIQKMGKLMNGFKGAAKWTGWGLLAEVGFAAPLGAIDYAKGANKDEIISNATYGLFGKSEDEQLREKYSDYGQAKDFQKTYDKLLKQENALDDQTGYGPIINPQNVKNTEKKLMEQSKQFDSVLPPSQGLRSEFDLGKFLNMVVTDQQRDKLFADQKAQRAEEIGILKPSTGLESYDNFMQGGIASLNVKK